VLEKQHGLANDGKTLRFQLESTPVISSETTSDGLIIDQVDIPEPEIEETPSLTDNAVPQAIEQSPDPGLSPQVLADALLRIVGEKTGYPPEMLELGMDLEADLGIDSIKRVEILGVLEEEFPSLPAADTEVLSQTRTLEEIVDYLKSETGQTFTPAMGVEKEESPHPATTTQLEKQDPISGQGDTPDAPLAGEGSVEELTSTLLDIVAEKTGYPAEMLELEMDLEADLGIDSIKRVEILGAMEERVPGLPQVETESLAELRTLAEIVSMMSSTQSTPLAQVGKGSESKKKVKGSSLEITPVRLTSIPKADFLEFEISPDHPVILTDEGTDFTLQLANALSSEGWKVVLWSYMGIKEIQNRDINPEIIQVKLKDPTPEAINDSLKALRDQFKSFSGFIHLHPSSDKTEFHSGPERDLIKMVFFLAGALKEDLSGKSESGRSVFMTVTRINGKLGLGPVENFQDASGLTGAVKSLSWEWPEVFTRSIDLDPAMSVDDQIERVIQEIHDPDRGLVEVGIAQDNRYTIEREGFG
jgi:acyl carrier protein